jgi:hypothetical protein
MEIKSVGPPPERHADRVVGEMLRALAVQKADQLYTIVELVAHSSDGTPRAQQKMAARLRRAGAINVVVETGKRGRYGLYFFDMTGWDAGRDAEIQATDPLPEKPWIVCYANSITSAGRGRNKMEYKAAPMLFITHHAFSRAAQRFGAHTKESLIRVATGCLQTLLKAMNEKGVDVFKLPPSGCAFPVGSSKIKIVIKVHEKHDRAFVVATVY